MRRRIHMRPSSTLVEYLVVSATDPMAGVTRDATSGKYYPANNTEMNTAITAAGLSGSASMLWNFQESSGNVADAIGSFTLTASGVNYQQSVAGETRNAITFDDGSTDSLTSASASLPDLLTQSLLIVAWIKMPAAAPAANRAFLAMGGAGTRFSALITTTPRLRGTHVSNNADSAASPCDGAVHFVAMRSNRSPGNEADLMTDSEKLQPTFSTLVAGKGVIFGSSAAVAAAAGVLWAAGIVDVGWSDVDIKALGQTLGASVAW